MASKALEPLGRRVRRLALRILESAEDMLHAIIALFLLAGGLLLLAGVLNFAVSHFDLANITALVIQVFQKNVSWDQLKPVVGILLVWGPSWLIHLILMRFYGNTAAAPRLRRATLED